MSELEEKEGGMKAFSVLVQQQTSKNGNVYRSVELLVYDMEITMETGVVWEVKVWLTFLYWPSVRCIPQSMINVFNRKALKPTSIRIHSEASWPNHPTIYQGTALVYLKHSTSAGSSVNIMFGPEWKITQSFIFPIWLKYRSFEISLKLPALLTHNGWALQIYFYFPQHLS